jgi:hypothetical protein
MDTIALTKEDVRERYRRWREINERLTASALKGASKHAVLEWFKRLGLLSSGIIRADTEAEIVLAMDLALYSAWMGQTPVIERYRKTFAASPGSEEAAVLDGMCNTRFCMLHVKGKHREAGLLVKDLLTNEDLWLMDESLERTVGDLPGIAARLIPTGDFMMTTGALVPLSESILMSILLKYRDLMEGTHPQLGTNARFATAVYRSAIDAGAMRSVKLG